MNKKLYWKQQLPLISLHLICMIALVVFLGINGNEANSIILILLVWSLVLSIYLWKIYSDKKMKTKELMELVEQLEERYLISEVMEKPTNAYDYVYYNILKMANKSMLEQIGIVKRERIEYKEYIEQWVHEIKNPITAMKLLCENHRSEFSKEMLVEIEKTNRFVEQVLYYARSEHTQKDYYVREIHLIDVIHQAIAENKYLLLQNGFHIEIQEINDIAYSDEKWVSFILNQLIVNSVKYRTEQPKLEFYIERQNNYVCLSIKDNGIGIDAGDLPRIFEKGFTGKNGRTATKNSTGIGLYLCKLLCNKLGIDICVLSNKNGTTVQLYFPINDFIHEVQE